MLWEAAMRKNSVEVSFTFDNQKVYQPLMPSNVMRVGSCCVRRSDEMEKLSRRNFLSTLFTLVLLPPHCSHLSHSFAQSSFIVLGLEEHFLNISLCEFSSRRLNAKASSRMSMRVNCGCYWYQLIKAHQIFKLRLKLKSSPPSAAMKPNADWRNSKRSGKYYLLCALGTERDVNGLCTSQLWRAQCLCCPSSTPSILRSARGKYMKQIKMITR